MLGTEFNQNPVSMHIGWTCHREDSEHPNTQLIQSHDPSLPGRFRKPGRQHKQASQTGQVTRDDPSSRTANATTLAWSSIWRRDHNPNEAIGALELESFLSFTNGNSNKTNSVSNASSTHYSKQSEAAEFHRVIWHNVANRTSISRSPIGPELPKGGLFGSHPFRGTHRKFEVRPFDRSSGPL